MKVTDLPAPALRALRELHYDRYIDKHEGPWGWSRGMTVYPGLKGVPPFIELAKNLVLLPVSETHHKNISVKRCIKSDNGRVLTLFIKDTTFGLEWYTCGFLVIAEKLPRINAFATILYHARFLLEEFPPTRIAKNRRPRAKNHPLQ